MSGHIDGRSVSASTYGNHACRCDGCRAAWRIYQRRFVSRRATSRARSAAASWVAARYPDVWDGLLDAAYESLGGERRPVGRPRKAAS